MSHIHAKNDPREYPKSGCLCSLRSFRPSSSFYPISLSSPEEPYLVVWLELHPAAAAAAVASVVSNSVRPQRRQPTRLRHPWDSPGKSTGVGCHSLGLHILASGKDTWWEECVHCSKVLAKKWHSSFLFISHHQQTVSLNLTATPNDKGG